MYRVSHFAAYAVLLLSLTVASFASLGTGAIELSASQIFNTLIASLDQHALNQIAIQDKIVILDIRLPRLFLAILVGAALACSGAAIQGLFRNPLADPGLIGVSSGAALGAVSMIVLGSTLLQGWSKTMGLWSIPSAAFLGGLLVTTLIYKIATRAGETSVATLLLAGIAINAIAGAGIGLLTYMADDAQLRSLTFWSMGSLAQANWSEISVVAPFILLPVIVIPLFARALNGFLMGEAVAGHLGFPIVWIKRGIITLSALAVGAAVAVSGTIGFIGLVVPHLLRLTIGPDHRLLLPASALAGAILLVLADMIARTIVAPAEMPIGLIMSLLGGPFFLMLLLSQRLGRSL